MNKEKKTYVEPNMKVVEVEATEIMAGSNCGTGSQSVQGGGGSSTCSRDRGAKESGFTVDEDASWND